MTREFHEQDIERYNSIVKLSTECEARLAFARTPEKRKKLFEQKLFILAALSKEDALKKLCLINRRELSDEGVPAEKLKVRSLELYNEGVRVIILSNSVDSGVRKGFINISQLNSTIFVHYE